MAVAVAFSSVIVVELAKAVAVASSAFASVVVVASDAAAVVEFAASSFNERLNELV